jgi:DUF1365 family protein
MHSSIFSGQVSHSRREPLEHAFRYSVFMMYLDLAELDKVFAKRWFWSVRRPALARFRREQHFGDPNIPLDTAVRDLVKTRTGARPDGPIRLLTNLSYFGYCINPISVFYCFDANDTRVTTIVAEVTNTPWDEKCCYVLDEKMNLGNETTRRFKTSKEMHVSPFMDMKIHYDWLITNPDQDLVVRIDNVTDDEKIFNATMLLERQEITGRSLASILVRYPFMTLKVLTGIYWQAVRLWWKGCPLFTHPDKRKSMQVST